MMLLRGSGVGRHHWLTGTWRSGVMPSDMGTLRTFVAVSAVLAFGAPGLAGSDSDGTDSSGSGDPLMGRLEQMQKQINDLKAENEAVRNDLNELRAKTGENWLTEQRAEEIRGIVQDTLVDADTRSSLLDSGLIAGWSDGFFLASPNGKFKLALDGLIQTRFVYNYSDDNVGFAIDNHRWGFENPRTKLTFRGHVFSRNTSYLVRGDFARNATDNPNDFAETRGGFFKLQDAWVRQQLNDYWSVRGGQFKLPFNREELVSPAGQLAVERSLINELLNVGR